MRRMKRIILACLAACFLCMGMPMAAFAKEEVETGAVSLEESNRGGILKVINAAEKTGNPLSGAVFAVYDGKGEEAGKLTVTGGEAGCILPSGNYRLKAEKAAMGFFVEKAVISFEIQEGKKTIVEITSERDPQALGMADPQTLIPKTGETMPVLPYGVAAGCFATAAMCAVSLFRTKRRNIVWRHISL